jgi:hypothetical protein
LLHVFRHEHNDAEPLKCLLASCGGVEPAYPSALPEQRF